MMPAYGYTTFLYTQTEYLKLAAKMCPQLCLKVNPTLLSHLFSAL